MEIMYRKNKNWNMVEVYSSDVDFKKNFEKEVLEKYPELENSIIEIIDVQLGEKPCYAENLFTVFFAIL